MVAAPSPSASPGERLRRGRRGDDAPVFGSADVPCAFVVVDVVAATQEHEVVEIGCPAIHPMDEMVDVAPLRRDATSWVLAMAVACDHGFAQRGADHSGRAAEIEEA
jgi:hypothetical protein